MRVLFDQGTPAPLRHLLPSHEVSTAYERGWSTLKNGELLAAAADRPPTVEDQATRTDIALDAIGSWVNEGGAGGEVRR